ncbi:hypothetical protein [Reichenbachiella sp.]|uniref:hypothetical protein n=1 Tax=Reichenbachiella sp. TaxID=2184521 RepID=UPI003BAE6EC1
MKIIIIITALLFTSIFSFAQNEITDTNSGADPLYILRTTNPAESFKISVDDRIGKIEYNQDETTDFHNFIFNINSSTSHYYHWRSNNSDLMKLRNNGTLYLNSSAPNHAGLNISFDQSTTNNGADVNLAIRTNSGSPIVDWYIQNWGGSYIFSRGSSNGKRDLFRIESNGDIVVPNGDAIIDGKLKSEEIMVEVMDVPDYVFADDYELSTLEETANYIEENHHLPEIPSATEMEANGMNVGEMNLLLLKKIEEITLHLIKMMEENKEMKKEIEELKLTKL